MQNKGVPHHTHLPFLKTHQSANGQKEQSLSQIAKGPTHFTGVRSRKIWQRQSYARLAPGSAGGLW